MPGRMQEDRRKKPGDEVDPTAESIHPEQIAQDSGAGTAAPDSDLDACDLPPELREVDRALRDYVKRNPGKRFVGRMKEEESQD